MTIFTNKNTSSLLTTTLRSTGVGALIAFSSFVMVGCESPTYSASDSLPNYSLNFDGDAISGHYLTESEITFNLTRNLEDESDTELSITSSDTSLLRPISRENESGIELDSFQQSFEVLSEGTVTIIFKDGDDSVLSREVELVNATSLESSRITHADMLRALSEGSEESDGEEATENNIVGEGEKVVIGGHYTLVIDAYRGENEEQELLSFDTYTKQPQSEQAEVTTSGREITIKPQQEGDVFVNVQLGGQDKELHVQGVSEEAIASLSVVLGDTGGNQENSEEIEGYAIMSTKDENDNLIYGASITWTRLAEDGETELNEILEGEMVTFERSETERVSFKVEAGSQSIIVELPMKQLSQILTSNNETLSCDAQGGLAAQLPLSILLMIIFIIRRQHQRATLMGFGA
jgi:hypothetical protein